MLELLLTPDSLSSLLGWTRHFTSDQAWGSGGVKIFLQGYPYAVTQHLLTRRNFLFLNSLKGFQRSLEEIS
jgi:hypothetical protein